MNKVDCLLLGGIIKIENIQLKNSIAPACAFNDTDKLKSVDVIESLKIINILQFTDDIINSSHKPLPLTKDIDLVFGNEILLEFQNFAIIPIWQQSDLGDFVTLENKTNEKGLLLQYRNDRDINELLSEKVHSLNKRTGNDPKIDLLTFDIGIEYNLPSRISMHNIVSNWWLTIIKEYNTIKIHSRKQLENIDEFLFIDLFKRKEHLPHQYPESYTNSIFNNINNSFSSPDDVNIKSDTPSLLYVKKRLVTNNVGHNILKSTEKVSRYQNRMSNTNQKDQTNDVFSSIDYDSVTLLEPPCYTKNLICLDPWLEQVQLNTISSTKFKIVFDEFELLRFDQTTNSLTSFYQHSNHLLREKDSIPKSSNGFSTDLLSSKLIFSDIFVSSRTNRSRKSSKVILANSNDHISNVPWIYYEKLLKKRANQNQYSQKDFLKKHKTSHDVKDRLLGSCHSLRCINIKPSKMTNTNILIPSYQFRINEIINLKRQRDISMTILGQNKKIR